MSGISSLEYCIEVAKHEVYIDENRAEELRKELAQLRTLAADHFKRKEISPRKDQYERPRLNE